MNTSDFDYFLPEELIAQTPVYPRDASRLMVVDRAGGGISHARFTALPGMLKAGDCLILNDSRVIPARLFAGAVEVLLLRDLGSHKWECITRPGKKTRDGTELVFNGGLTARVVESLDDGVRVLQFNDEITIGEMPLPPYIHERLTDSERYQTVYAKERGSSAAPTAGLHFTPALLDDIRACGVAVEFVTLHVGLGTFRPVKVENIAEHKMHAEYYTIPQRTADAVRTAKAVGGRVIAVGTTTCRALESAALDDGTVMAKSASTDIFITPGYRFKAIDGLLTNFHLPKSTLIMLVSAFLGRERTLAAYKAAVGEKYRFFSFGDAMLIV